MKLSQFKFKLTEEQIAKYPAKNRDESRLMVVHRNTGEIEHRIFKDILEYFDDKDVFVFNDTKVFPARLYGNKEKTGAKIEVFLLRELNEENRLWDVLVDPARKIRIGNKLYFGEDDSMVAEVIDNTTSRGRTLRFLFDGTHEEFKEALAAAQDVLANVDATQEEVEDAASALNQAMANLRKIPDKSALEALVQELSAISGDDYTAQSYAALRASLNIAMQVLEDPNATQEEVDSAIDACNDAKEKLTEVHHSSNSGSGSSSSGSSSSSGKVSGEGTSVVVPSAVVAAAQNVSTQAYVRSDTTVNFTLMHGQAYCFKMTVVNGNNLTPSFTVRDAVSNLSQVKTLYPKRSCSQWRLPASTSMPRDIRDTATTADANASMSSKTLQ